MIASIKADFSEDQQEKDKQDNIVSNIEDFILSTYSPNVFKEGDPSNVIYHMDLSFEKLCASMEEAGVRNPKKLTVFEFYSKMEYFQSKNKKK